VCAWVCVCVCSSYLVDGNGVQQPAALCEYLCAAGINTVVSGHTPHGDAPNPMDTQAAGGSALRVLSAVRADHTPHTTHHTPHTATRPTQWTRRPPVGARYGC
jgi:hypothetical protein